MAAARTLQALGARLRKPVATRLELQHAFAILQSWLNAADNRYMCAQLTPQRARRQLGNVFVWNLAGWVGDAWTGQNPNSAFLSDKTGGLGLRMGEHIADVAWAAVSGVP